MNLQPGSSAANGKDVCVFLIAVTNSIGDIEPKTAGWYRAVHSHQALDEATKELGNCKILKSVLSPEYDNYCELAVYM